MRLLFSLAISAVFLYLALRGLDFAAIGRSLTTVNALVLLPAAVIHLSSFWVRSLRWRGMLAPIKAIPARRLFPVISIAYLANNTLPMRAGEFIRAFLLGQEQDVSKTASFSTIMLERVFDGLTLLLLFGVVALLMPLPVWANRIGLLAGAGFVGVSVVLVGLVLFRSLTLRIVSAVTHLLPASISGRVDGMLRSFVTGLDVIQSGRGLLVVMGWSLVVWGLEAAALYMVALAFGYPLPVLAAFFALVIINLGTMVPSSPGYVGTFEFFCVKSLAVAQVPEATAMGFALVLHVVQFLPITLVGMFFLTRQRLSLRGMALQKGIAG